MGIRTTEAAYLAGNWYWFMCSLKIQLSINNECLLSTEYHAGSRDIEGIRKWTTMFLHRTGPRRKPTKDPDSQWQYEARKDSQNRASALGADPGHEQPHEEQEGEHPGREPDVCRGPEAGISPRKSLYRVVSLKLLWGRVLWRVCPDSSLGCTFRDWIQQVQRVAAGSVFLRSHNTTRTPPPEANQIGLSNLSVFRTVC